MGTLEKLMKKNHISGLEMRRLLNCSKSELAAYCSGQETLNRERLLLLAERFSWTEEQRETFKRSTLFDTCRFYGRLYEKMKKLSKQTRTSLTDQRPPVP